MKIALIFDFDDTLVKDSLIGYAHTLGFVSNKIWQTEVDGYIDQGWDPVLAFLLSITHAIQGEKKIYEIITQQSLIEYAKKLDYFEGVEHFFDMFRKKVTTIDNRIEIQYFLISSGIETILKHSNIACYFYNIWGSDLYFDTNGHFCIPKRMMSFTDKTRYLFHIHKGLTAASQGNLFDVNKTTKTIDIPFSHMVFIGDGFSDIPCFSLLKNRGGKSIAVSDPHDDHSDKSDYYRDQLAEIRSRVDMVCRRSFLPDSEIVNTLLGFIEDMNKTHKY